MGKTVRIASEPRRRSCTSRLYVGILCQLSYFTKRSRRTFEIDINRRSTKQGSTKKKDQQAPLSKAYFYDMVRKSSGVDSRGRVREADSEAPRQRSHSKRTSTSYVVSTEWSDPETRERPYDLTPVNREEAVPPVRKNHPYPIDPWEARQAKERYDSRVLAHCCAAGSKSTGLQAWQL